MYKKQFLFMLLFSSLVISGCSDPQRRAFPQGDINTGMPPAPPSGMFLLPPNGGPMGDAFRKKMEDACLSGVLQTGSNFFNELTKNITEKEGKLLFIKDKLESIADDASSESKKKISEELTIINALIQEVKDREIEFKTNPNKICMQRGAGLVNMNKKMKESILDLSGNMSAIREHEKNEGFLKNIAEKVFFQENSGEDRKRDAQEINQKAQESEPTASKEGTESKESYTQKTESSREKTDYKD